AGGRAASGRAGAGVIAHGKGCRTAVRAPGCGSGLLVDRTFLSGPRSSRRHRREVGAFGPTLQLSAAPRNCLRGELGRVPALAAGGPRRWPWPLRPVPLLLRKGSLVELARPEPKLLAGAADNPVKGSMGRRPPSESGPGAMKASKHEREVGRAYRWRGCRPHGGPDGAGPRRALRSAARRRSPFAGGAAVRPRRGEHAHGCLRVVREVRGAP